MEGFDKDWIQSGTGRVATYTNLDPGTYTFTVKGSNSDGVWNEEGKSIQLIILPPWYMTWWFVLQSHFWFSGLDLFILPLSLAAGFETTIRSKPDCAGPA